MNNKTLFENKKLNSNIGQKIRRYFIEKELGHLANNNIIKYKQVAVFAFDYISNLVNIDGIYEIDDLKIFTEWLESYNEKEIFNGIVLDIGANIGNHSLFFSDYFTQIYSYEPHPLIYKILLFNASLVNNVKCFNFAVSDNENIGTIKYNKRNMGGGRIDIINNNNNHNYESQEKIHINSIDNLFQIEKKDITIKLIKIDVEGFDENEMTTSVLPNVSASIKCANTF